MAVKRDSKVVRFGRVGVAGWLVCLLLAAPGAGPAVAGASGAWHAGAGNGLAGPAVGNGLAGPAAGNGLAGPAASADCNIAWNEVLHDSFSDSYRTPAGPVTTGTTVRLRLRVAQGDITGARVRVWNDRSNVETYLNMQWDGGFDTDPVTYDWWYADLDAGSESTLYYYFFEINDAPGWCTADQDFYVDDDPKFYGGGYGAMSDNYTDQKSYQLTVYDPSYAVPAWMQQGIVYQIFPERFRDGSSGNDPAAGRFSYDVAGGAIVRSNQSDWNTTVCDPRGVVTPACAGHYSDNFYGGDLRGVIQKIQQGYFDNLGISALYLNPIFRSPSNHKYDTADYMAVDPDFGTLADFQELATQAHSHGIRLILDGVFNHTSSDSKYFDYYRRYDAAGNVTSPSGTGSDDNSGACESPNSTFRNWYYVGGTQPDAPAEKCDPSDGDDPGGTWTDPYQAWYAYASLPKLQANSTAVRSLIWSNGTGSVGPYWVSQGADGWRFDVGADVDPGVTADPGNDYWEGFRSAVRAVNPQVLTLGEEWGDASPWLLGSEWDSVMNYRFRSALLSWLFTGCSGDGCSGGSFSDNDSNSGSPSGAIGAISPSQFNARLRSIAEDYPPAALKAMMNLEGSHDTNRVRFLLKKTNNDSDSAAVQRMKEWWIVAFTYPGAPTLYYGDEIGLSQDGVYNSGKWEDDPYNRVPYPWPDATGSAYGYDANAANAGLQDFARKMASIRWSYRALQDGDVQHGLIIDDTNKMYGYARTNGSQTALIALNRDGATHTAAFTGLNAAPTNLPNGTVLVNALDTTQTYTVDAANGGSISAPVTPTWGAVLVEQSKIDAPAAVIDLAGTVAGGSTTLTWSTVTADTGGNRELVTAYTIHRDPSHADFTPAASNLTGTVTPSDAAFRYGSDGGKFTFTQAATGFYYKVCPVNAAGVQGACSSAFSPLAVTLASFTAAARGSAVELTWETVSERDTAGYNVYRAAGDRGPQVKLNAALIPSLAPGSGEGRAYGYVDAAALTPNTTYRYWLEDVSKSGVATWHEPVTVFFAAPTAVELSYVIGRPVGWVRAAAALLAGVWAEVGGIGRR